MKKYLFNLLEDKGISLSTPINVDGKSGTNFMNIEVVIEHILITTKEEQKEIKNILVKIDLMNGDILHFLKHLAKAIAI
jgi:hypothetical protein